jgi:hypothetical protein
VCKGVSDPNRPALYRLVWAAYPTRHGIPPGMAPCAAARYPTRHGIPPGMAPCAAARYPTRHGIPSCIHTAAHTGAGPSASSSSRRSSRWPSGACCAWRARYEGCS